MPFLNVFDECENRFSTEDMETIFCEEFEDFDDYMDMFGQFRNAFNLFVGAVAECFPETVAMFLYQQVHSTLTTQYEYVGQTCGPWPILEATSDVSGIIQRFILRLEALASLADNAIKDLAQSLHLTSGNKNNDL